MLLEMNCKSCFFESGNDLLREATEGWGFFFAYRQVLEALKNLTGFWIRKPKLD